MLAIVHVSYGPTNYWKVPVLRFEQSDSELKGSYADLYEFTNAWGPKDANCERKCRD